LCRIPQQTMPGAPPNLLKPKLLSRQIFVPKYWRNYFSPFGKPICQTKLQDCQFEFVLPNRIAKSNCRIVKLNSFRQIEMPNRIAKSKCQIKLPNWNI
jgi:hypothetical protein